MPGIRDKVVVITGASSGIGEATAKAFYTASPRRCPSSAGTASDISST